MATQADHQITPFYVDAKTSKHHEMWRERVRAGLPALTVRVFALREYSERIRRRRLEHKLGALLLQLNDDIDAKPTLFRVMREQITAESLYRDVGREERGFLAIERALHRNDER